MLGTLHPAAVGAVALLLVLALTYAIRYRRYRPDHAIIVYGLVGGDSLFKLVFDRGVFVRPLTQDSCYLDLRPFEFEEGTVRVDRNGLSEAVASSTALSDMRSHIRRWIDEAGPYREAIAIALAKKGYVIEFRNT